MNDNQDRRHLQTSDEDDVEGHAKMAIDDSGDDVEGHVASRKIALDGDGEDDVEGHVIKRQ